MKRHALFVGVDKYSDSTIQDLNYPSEDATELASVFRRLLKFNRVEKLINPKHSPEVVDAVKDMTRGLGPGDLFLFFFAGHGFRVKENHVLVCAKDEFADLEDEYAGLPVGQLKKRMRGPWNRMLILDACQNDIRATRGADTGVTERDLALIHEAEGSSSESGYQIVLTACSEGQKALEVSDLGHGLFTSAFLDSVTSFADARRRLDLEALRADLGKRMGGLIAQYRLSGRQEPLFTMPTDASGIVLLDGVVSVAVPSTNSPVMVECPICGKHNRVEETFKCKVCGKNHLCMSHFSAEDNCCIDCVKKIQLKENTQKAIEAYNSNDYARAFTLAQKSDQSIAVIQYVIGYGYENGFGCEKNQGEAIKWYRKAQEQGYETALVRLKNIWIETAMREAEGKRNVDKDKFWEEVSNSNSDETRSGSLLLSAKSFRDELYDKIMRIDWHVALELIEDANALISAELTEDERLAQALVHSHKNLKTINGNSVNDPYLQFQIGMILYACPGELDKTSAVKWFEKSAKQKCSPSLYMMGRMYEYGECVEQSYRKAKMLFDMVDMNFPMQQVAMAHIYEFGLDGENEDVGAAAEWYQYAIEEFGGDLVMPLYLRAQRTYDSLNPAKLPKLSTPTVGDATKMPFSRALSSLQPRVTENTKKAIESAVEAYKAETAACYRKVARDGDVKAQYELGKSLAVLFDDRLRKKEELEGIDWLRKAADSGYAEAQYYLGYYLLWYYDTRDAPKALQPEGIGWLQKASENGHVKAQNLLAYSYKSGDGVERNYELAIKYYRAAAEQGHVESQYDLGRCYEQGLGVEANLNEALHWYFRAANQGNKDAQYKVGWCRYYGKGYPPDYSEAVTWFRKAAEQGHTCAQFYLGWCYYKGDGIVQNLEEAIKWYRKAAEQGDIDACYNLGYCYDNGEGVERDCVAAVKWYRKAADLGYALAQGNLGWMYANGEGVKQDDREALSWFRKAAEQGQDNAQYSVGWMYENGRGVTKSDAEAVKWYVKAAEQGHEEALSNITSMAEQGCVDAQYNLALEVISKPLFRTIHEPSHAT